MAQRPKPPTFAEKQAVVAFISKEIGCDLKHAEFFYNSTHRENIARNTAEVKKFTNKFGIHAAEVYLDKDWINALVELYIITNTRAFARSLLLLRRLARMLKGKQSKFKFLPLIPNMSTLIRIVIHYPLDQLEKICKIQNIEKRRRQIESL